MAAPSSASPDPAASEATSDPRIEPGDVGERDRDASGRARQSRPRDALGRPLPYGSTGVDPVPEEPLSPLDTIEAARELVRVGRPFSAHEVLEARWKAAPEQERDLWQGLAQLCVGLTHDARGNHLGAARLFERGAGRLTTYRGTSLPTHLLDLDALIACAQDRRDRATAASDPAPRPAAASDSAG